jgi:hypothetical protein
MRTAIMTSAISGSATHAAQRRLGTRLVGLAIASLVPAFFWAGVLELVSHGLGVPISLGAVEMTGGAIALFLMAVCWPLMLRGNLVQDEPAFAFARRPTQRTAPAFSMRPEFQAHVFKRDV